MHIAILRNEKLPRFVSQDPKLAHLELTDLRDLYADDYLLMDALVMRGHHATHVIWSDPDIDWAIFDAALIRSTWDYIDRVDEFLLVLDTIEETSCKLYNPLAAVRWNTDKQYLLNLYKINLPIVPTWDADDFDLTELQEIFQELEWSEVVIKPSIGGGASKVHKMPLDKLAAELSHIRRKYPDHQFLIQPMIDSVVEEGEWSFVFINGQHSHTMLKKAAHGDYRVQGIYGGTIEIREPSKSDQQMAQEIFDKLPFDLLYARIDLVRVGDSLAIMELELIEPILNYSLVPEKIELFADALIQRLQG